MRASCAPAAKLAESAMAAMKRQRVFMSGNSDGAWVQVTRGWAAHERTSADLHPVATVLLGLVPGPVGAGEHALVVGMAIVDGHAQAGTQLQALVGVQVQRLFADALAQLLGHLQRLRA